MENIKFYRRLYVNTPEMIIFEDYGDLHEAEKNNYTYVVCKDIKKVEKNDNEIKISLSDNHFCAVDFNTGLILIRHKTKKDCIKYVEENCERLIISGKNFQKRYSTINTYAKSSGKYEK